MRENPPIPAVSTSSKLTTAEAPASGSLDNSIVVVFATAWDAQRKVQDNILADYNIPTISRRYADVEALSLVYEDVLRYQYIVTLTGFFRFPSGT